MVNGIKVTHKQQIFRHPPIPYCDRKEWRRDVLDGFHDGEFVFPIGILDDPNARLQFLLNEDTYSLRHGVGRMVMTLYGKYDLSRAIKVDMSIRFCEIVPGRDCGLESWNKKFVQASLQTRPSTESGTDALLVVRFSSDVDGTK